MREEREGRGAESVRACGRMLYILYSYSSVCGRTRGVDEEEVASWNTCKLWKFCKLYQRGNLGKEDQLVMGEAMGFVDSLCVMGDALRVT